ncbi:tetratricopeptide repeat protein [Winogradskyella sp. 3972H.M.0a.05]|uniref:tetratricopeptide repeat protein n=1 Tax=Winogradskyella sp. 3972H.M.0a.05 TaxID=2950277 RepID=UPI00339369C2
MATYKKRGYKKPTPKVKKDKDEELFEGESATKEVFNTLDETANKTEEWVAKNQKAIFTVVGVIAVVVLGYLGYDKYIAAPKNQEAMNEMFKAQQYFDQAVNGVEKDSLYTLSLHGGEGKLGMIDIADQYSGTDAGNLANYYAGMAYLNLKDYQNAITYLSDFSSNDEMLAPIAKGGIGDAFVQLNQPQDALGYYEEAAKMKSNDFTTPMYLLKAANVAMSLGDNAKALGYLKQIKDEFPKSSEATQVEVLIGKAEASL